MKKPICGTCQVPMEPTGRILVKEATAKSPQRYITSNHTCPNCSAETPTPQHIIDNAQREPSSKPKPKQRVAYNDAMKMFEPHSGFGPRWDYCLMKEDVEKLIRKLTRP